LEALHAITKNLETYFRMEEYQQGLKSSGQNFKIDLDDIKNKLTSPS
jgi:hypothetical protein